MYQIVLDKNDWDACLTDIGLSTVFYERDFAQLFLPGSSLFVCRDKNQLAVVVISGPGQVVTGLHYGGIFTNSKDKSFHLEVIKSLKDYLNFLGVKDCYLRNHPFLDTLEVGEPVKEEPFIFIDLTSSEDELISAITKQHLRCARKAKEKGFVVVLEDHPKYLEIFYKFYKTCQQEKRNQYREYAFFQKMFVLLKQRLIFSVVRDDKNIVAVSLLLRDLGGVYMTYGGMSSDGYKNHAKHLMIMELIMKFKAKGFSRLILGTGCNGKDSIYKFKKGFTNQEHRVLTYKI